MASIQEALRIVLETEGREGIEDLRKALAQMGDASELTREQVDSLAGEMERFGEAAAASENVKNAIKRYEELARTQGDVAAAMDAARLKLEILAKAEADAAAAVAEKRAVLEQSQQALDAYKSSVDKTSVGLSEQMKQVRDASRALDSANASWEGIRDSLKKANGEFDKAHDAQTRFNASLEKHATTIRDAGLSTDDLAGAQAELGQRMEAASKRMGELATEAIDATRAERELAEATREAADAAARAERDFDAAFRALGGGGALRDTSAEIERLESAYRTLANSGKLSTEQLERAQAQLQTRVAKLREGTADYRAEQDRASVSTDRLRDETDKLGHQSGVAAKAVDGLKAGIAGLVAGVSVGAIGHGAAELLELADAAERTEQQFARLYGGLDQGNAALDRIRELAADLGQSYEGLRESAASLKTFGLDPLDGTLQALIDTNAAMGGSQQKLEGMILAVGQAWSKQKLQQEEALQLMERGVPVWDLLAQATGKTSTELMKLATAGKLGRDAIAQLVQAMGTANFGAAAEQARSFVAQLTALKDGVTELAVELGRGGLDGAANAIGAVTDKLEELARSPEFQTLKQNFATAFSEGAEAAKTLMANLDAKAAVEQLTQLVSVLNSVASMASIAAQHAGTFQKLSNALSPFNEMLGATEWALRKQVEAYDWVSGKIDEFRGKVDEATTTQERFNEKVEQAGPGLVETWSAVGQAVFDAGKKVVEVTTQANESVDSLAAKGAKVYAELQAAIKEGTDPAAVQRLQAEFDELQQRIKNAEATGYALSDSMLRAAGVITDVADAFGVLKITSQAALKTTRDEAERAFASIVVGAREGKAATEDVARAFEVYARAALAAAKYSDEATQKQVESQLRVKASVLGLTDSLERLGLVAKDAGDKTESSAERARQSMQGLAAAAEDASQSIENMGDASQTTASAATMAASELANISTQAQQASIDLQGTSAAFQDAVNSSASALGRNAGALWSGRNQSRIWEDLRAQSEELDRQVALLQEQNLAYDEVGARVLALRQQYSYLSDDRLRALAQEQLKAEENGISYAGQNRTITDGNKALAERNKLLNQQANNTSVTTNQNQTIQTTQVIELRLTSAVGRVVFDVNQISEADKRAIAKFILDTIKRDVA